MKKLFLLLMTVVAFTLSAAAQSTVSGTVYSEADGEPLAGATVLPVGGGNGVATDIDGKFTLKVSAHVKRLVVSYVGMVTRQVDITPGEMRIALSNNENLMDEVMVVAYGTAKKSAYTGSASVVKADALEDRLVSNVSNALSGAVSGVQTLSSNGQPGTESTVLIRGVGSLYADNDPLYVLDGVPYDGDIAAINPADIESMTVLKDAAAAALYGARGANGVILITTKRGKAGDAKVTFDARWGSNSRQITNYDVIKDPAQYMELMYQAQYNAARYTMGYSEAASHVYANEQLVPSIGYQIYTVPQGQYLVGLNGKLNPNARLGYSDGEYYYTPDDWSDVTYRNGLRQEYNLSVSGGNDRLNYYVSAAYLEDEGIISNSAFDRLSTRASIDYQAKKWLKVGTNLSYTFTESNYPAGQIDNTGGSDNAFGIANKIAPVYPIFVRNADGTVAIDSRFNRPIYDYGDGVSTNNTRQFMPMSNPASDLIYNYDKYLADVFNGKWYVQLNPVDGLTLTGNLGLMVDNTRTRSVGSPYYGQSAAIGGSAAQVAERYKSLNLQGLANYKKSFGGHTVDVLAGYESYDYDYEYVQGYGTGLYNDQGWAVNNTLLSARRGYGAATEYATRGIIARVNYDFDTKYYGSVSYRRDASSRFHPDNRWGDFFSVSAAWDIAKEKFMDDAEWVDMLKVKASFGQQGNDRIGNYYAYLDQYTISGTDSWSDGNLAYKGNPELTWEKSNAFNVGVDFSLWQSKLSGTIEYFNRETSDMLYDKPVSPSLGYSTIPVNIGSMRNNGLEIELFYRPVETKNFTWDVNFNATFINNKILELAPELNGEMISGSRILREGESMYQYYFVEYAGVNPENGKAQYWALRDVYQLDENGEQVLDENEEPIKIGEEEYITESWQEARNTNRKATGDLLPTVYGGIGTTLKAYGFDLSVQCAYQLGGQIWDYGYQDFMHSGTSSSYGVNWHKDILNAWTPANPYTDVPRLDAQDPYSFYSYTSDRVLVSSDYFAINNITLGYTLPSRLTKKIGIETLRIYGAADNVALFSARKGLDPRQSYLQASTSTYTAMRCISGGIKVVF